MQLTHQLKLDDLVAFNLYYMAHSAVYRAQRFRYRVIPSILYLVFAALMFLAQMNIWGIVSLALAILWFLFAPRWTQRRSRNVIQKQFAEMLGDSITDPVTVELCDDGIHISSSHGQSIYNYSAVGQIVDDTNHTYIYIGKGTAIILPNDSVTPAQKEAMVAGILAKKELMCQPPVTGGD